MENPNYRVYANIGESSKSARCFSSIVDIEAGSSYITLKELPTPLHDRIKPLKVSPSIRKAREKTVPVAPTIELAVQICTSQTTVTFLVSKQLATEVILCCDLCDYDFEAIKPPPPR